MQTFLPYADFAASAYALDRQRLGKQRVENLQIMRALTLPEAGWKNHPATKMWEGHEWALLEYQRAICAEWGSRGYKDTCLDKTEQRFLEFMNYNPVNYDMPSWLGDEAFHASHRSNLLRKDPDHYS